MKKRIRASSKYPGYWEYDGKPTLLLGGSSKDNLFQIHRLDEELDLIRSVGGNYVRCTMSSRDKGNVWAFEKRNGAYDLTEPCPKYWQRFERFLNLTYERDIIVQVEIWATFTFYKFWNRNPFNPKNNCNYTAEESGISEIIDTHPVLIDNRFFFSVPEWNNNEFLLSYQQRFVDRLLHHSLEYPHVLYCIDNETSVTWRWPKYWSEYIQKQAKDKGVSVEITEMWNSHLLYHETQLLNVEHPELFSYAEVSQNNHQVGQAHWDTAQRFWERFNGVPRPMNNVKVYGSDETQEDHYSYGSKQEGIERFWRNIFVKAASVRFHRPPAGIGISPSAQAQIKSARVLTESIDIFTSEPRNELIEGRNNNQAYCLTGVDELAVFFPKKTNIRIKHNLSGKTLTIRWLDIPESLWTEQETVESDSDTIVLNVPKNTMMAAVVREV